MGTSSKGAAPPPGLPAATVVERGGGTSGPDLLAAALKTLRLPTLLRRARLTGRACVVLVPGGGELARVNPDVVARLTVLLESAGLGETHVLDGTPLAGLPGPDVERAPADLPEGALLRGVPLPAAWSEDAVRVVLSRAATDPVQGFLGACAALAGLLPADCALPTAAAVADLLRHLPPHLSVVDATAGSDGCFGSVRRGERSTATVVAGTSPQAVDEVLAGLMAVDQAVSPIVAAALQEVPLPVPRQISGDLRPWPGWRPVPRELTNACQRAEQVVPGLARVLRDVAADDPGTGEDTVLTAARRWCGSAVSRADDDPVALSGLVMLIEGLAFWANAGRAWATVAAKDRLPRREVSLGLDLSRYRAQDYDAVADYMAPLMQLAEQAPVRPGGLRWRRYGNGVLFVMEREVAAPYDAWVARVDLSRAIRLMNDYIGGAAVVVARDDQGRVLRQAERNLYLPQPNYLAFSGGDVIDVCKLEALRYADGESTIAWQTVRSPNGSAVHDDGAVTFRDVGSGRTLVRVYGLQEFTLPPFWETVDLRRYPAVHDALTDDAYRRFFRATLDNFEACYEGRPVSTGRPVQRDPEPPTARLSRTLKLAADALGGDEAPALLRRGRPQRDVDEDGFHHVPGDAAGSAASGPVTRVSLVREGGGAMSSLLADLRKTLDRDLARGAER